MIQVTDHLERHVLLPKNPQRIVSLCPSITETLLALGASNQIVGRTQFCIHPKNQVTSIQRVGGTKNVSISRVMSCKPDLIIAEKEENTKEVVEAMAQHFPVYVMDVTDIPSAYRMIRDLGKILHVSVKANQLVEEIQTSLEPLHSKVSGKSVVYVIWNDPIHVVGKSTYIDAILTFCGWKNIGVAWEGRYPVTQFEHISNLKPDWVFLSSEPFPFKPKHKIHYERHLPHCSIELVDGEAFSWYGIRMKYAATYLKELVDKTLK